MWSEHWKRAHYKTRNQQADEYDLPIAPQAKERHGPRGSRLRTRTWEEMVAEAITSQAPPEPPRHRIGLEILFLINSKSPPKHDLSNAIKTVEDAFNRRAYHDDNQIDYLSGLRVWSPEVENHIEARIYEF
jgi:Holliday junction resolvase RusA-like endonuclease